jgi:hypothetical protein
MGAKTHLSKNVTVDLDDYILAPRWGYGEYRGRPDVIKVFDSLNARITRE